MPGASSGTACRPISSRRRDPVRLLLTRPEPDAARTAAALRAAGHQVLAAPILRVAPVAADLGTGPWGAVLLTSANAARAVAAHPRRHELARCPVMAVGRRSADAARLAGFADVASADGDVVALAALAAARFAGTGARLLYLAGHERTGDLAGALGRHGIDVQTAVIYDAVLQELPPDARAALAAGAIDGVLHYSPRSAAAFLDGARHAGLMPAMLATAHYCLSAAVAAPLVAAGAATVRIAPAPDEAALLRLIAPAPED
jgi:uroporphyrinogen-III synthase